MNLVRGGTSSSPASLFAAAEPGTWYDPSQITTLFQDNAGTTPVTAPNQQVGLMLDKSKGLVLGPELVTNGNNEVALYSGAGAVGGTIARGAAPGGGFAAVFTCNAGTFSYQALYQTIAANTPVKISVRVYVPTGSLNAIQLFDAIDGSWSTATISTKDSWVTINAIRPAKATSWALGIGQTATQALSGQVFYLDDLSVRLLPGNHATQATSTQRPIYGINPITGTRNLLTYTEQFDNAIWNKGTGGSISANSVVAPDGTTTADAYTFATSTSVYSYLAQTTAGVSQSANTFSVWLKRPSGSGNRTIRLSVSDVDVSTGQSSTFTVTEVWQRFQFTRTSASTTGKLGVGFFPGVSGTPIAAGQVLEVWGAQIEQSATATAYQKVVSQYEVTQAGVQSASYLAFDGVDDGMVTGTITPAIDKAQVFTGARKLSDSASGMLVELGDGTSQSGIFGLRFPSLALSGATFSSRGTSSGNATTTGIPAPSTNVLTGLGDIAAPSSVLRSNGVQVAIDTATQGTGNYLAYPIYLGRRAGTSNPFNGRIYSLIVRFGANLTDGQITATESWVNGKTGAY